MTEQQYEQLNGIGKEQAMLAQIILNQHPTDKEIQTQRTKKRSWIYRRSHCQRQGSHLQKGRNMRILRCQ